jgi:hypothetical protein
MLREREVCGGLEKGSLLTKDTIKLEGEEKQKFGAW